MCSTWGALEGRARCLPSGHMQKWNIAKNTPCSQRIASGALHKRLFTKGSLVNVLFRISMKGLLQYGVHWRLSLGMVHPPNGHAI